MVITSNRKEIKEGDTVGYKIYTGKSKELTSEGFFIFHVGTINTIFSSKYLLERFKFDHACERLDTLGVGNKLFINVLAGHLVKYEKIYAHSKLTKATYYSSKNMYNAKVSMMESCDSTIAYNDSTGLLSFRGIYDGKTELYSISFHKGKVIELHERKKQNGYELITKKMYYDNGIMSEEVIEVLPDKMRIAKRYFRDGVLWSEYITRDKDEIYSYEKQ